MIYTKRKLFAITAFVLIIFTTSCTTEEYYETYEDGAKIETYYFDVSNSTNQTVPNRWVWNQDLNRYECVFDINKVTDYIYEKGVIHAAVFFDEEYVDNNNQTAFYETLKSLPFMRTYWDDSHSVFYEETINYDIAPGNPYSICFYVETDNGSEYGNYLKNLTFKVSLLWY